MLALEAVSAMASEFAMDLSNEGIEVIGTLSSTDLPS
jgi:hypothetical protein